MEVDPIRPDDVPKKPVEVRHGEFQLIKLPPWLSQHLKENPEKAMGVFADEHFTLTEPVKNKPSSFEVVELEAECRSHYVMNKSASGVNFQGKLTKKLQLRPSFKDARKQLKIRQVQEERDAHRTQAAEGILAIVFQIFFIF